MIRLGVIGLGQRMAAVLRALKRAGADIEVTAYCDPAPVGLDLVKAENISVGQSHASTAALLAAGPFDLLTIGSPNHLHAEHLRAAFEQKAPIFAEKPIVRTENESLDLAARLAKGGTPPLFIGLVMRSAPLTKEVLRLVRSGALGQIVSIDATEHLPPEHGAYLARNWRRSAAYGGSFLLDKVCHDFDVFQLIAGARAARVASFGGRDIFKPERAPALRNYSDGTPAYGIWPGGWAKHDDAFASDMDVADNQVAIVQYANGARLSFHANSHVALRERRWYVAGTKATLIADFVRNTLIWRDGLDLAPPHRQKFSVSEEDHNGADVWMARDLLAALRGQAPFTVTPLEALEAGLTVMALDRAMGEGAIVDCAQMWSKLDAAHRP